MGMHDAGNIEVEALDDTLRGRRRKGCHLFNISGGWQLTILMTSLDGWVWRWFEFLMMHSPDRQRHALHMWELNHLDEKKSQVIVNDSKLLPLSLSHKIKIVLNLQWQRWNEPLEVMEDLALCTLSWKPIMMMMMVIIYINDDDGDHVSIMFWWSSS